MANEKLLVESLVSTKEGQRILQLKGPLTIATVFAFQSIVRADATPTLILDISAVPYMDSAGLGVLVAAYIAHQKTGQKIGLVGMNERVRALLQMTKVGELFPAYPTLAQAEESLG
jgi:anti-sigma B factor antagonist